MLKEDKYVLSSLVNCQTTDLIEVVNTANSGSGNMTETSTVEVSVRLQDGVITPLCRNKRRTLDQLLSVLDQRCYPYF